MDRISQENQRMKLELEAFQKKFSDLEQFAKSIGKGNGAFQDRVSIRCCSHGSMFALLRFDWHFVCTQSARISVI